MPRSLEEALAHADELAAEFEAFDPTDASHIDPAEYALQRAARARARAEREVADAVVEARRHDVPWRTIGESLGVTPQSAQRRYSVLVDASKTSISKRTAAPSALSKRAPSRSVSGAVAARLTTSGARSIRTKAAANVKAARAAAATGKKAAKRSSAGRDAGRA